MITETFSSLLGNTFHTVSQMLLVPVMFVLLIFLFYAVISLGVIFYEYKNRRQTKTDFEQMENMILSIAYQKDPKKIIHEINSCKMSYRHRNILVKLVKTSHIGPESKEALARKIIENEENEAAKKLEKTDIIAKIGPAVGLMGTLIPLGPGLAALGAGDIQNLASHLIVAFDAAVLGMASAALGFTISKIRRRWYEEDISSLDTMAESVLEVLKS